jgi:hypothetical protein
VNEKEKKTYANICKEKEKNHMWTYVKKRKRPYVKERKKPYVHICEENRKRRYIWEKEDDSNNHPLRYFFQIFFGLFQHIEVPTVRVFFQISFGLFQHMDVYIVNVSKIKNIVFFRPLTDIQLIRIHYFWSTASIQFPVNTIFYNYTVIFFEILGMPKLILNWSSDFQIL